MSPKSLAARKANRAGGIISLPQICSGRVIYTALLA
jgi:hypothetical protein